MLQATIERTCTDRSWQTSNRWLSGTTGSQTTGLIIKNYSFFYASFIFLCISSSVWAAVRAKARLNGEYKCWPLSLLCVWFDFFFFFLSALWLWRRRPTHCHRTRLKLSRRRTGWRRAARRTPCWAAQGPLRWRIASCRTADGEGTGLD